MAAFSLADWGVLCEGTATVAVVQVMLHAVEFPRVVAWVERVRPVPDPRWSRARVDRVAYLVNLAGRATMSRCLVRSLALSRVLKRRGVATDLRIGVQSTPGTFKAHAWVEWMGHVLNDTPGDLEGFVPFESPIGHSNG